MATINNIPIFVETEDVDRSTQIPQHPVEKGLPLTDNVRTEPTKLSISGKIVDAGNYTAATIIAKLDDLRKKGSLVKYVGRDVFGDYLIKSFPVKKDNKVWGGATFDMELQEVRIAKSAYNPKKSQQQTTKKAAAAIELKVGAIVVFKGGSVYVSSDATKPAATRGRSTCKITIINERSWSKHDYHLISTDGGKVYGWVDKANIEGTGTSSGTSGNKTTSTKANTKSGTQQVKEAKTEMVVKGYVLSDLVVGSKSLLDKDTVTVNGAKWYRTTGAKLNAKSYDTVYLQISKAKQKATNNGRNVKYYFPKGIGFYIKNTTATGKAAVNKAKGERM